LEWNCTANRWHDIWCGEQTVDAEDAMMASRVSELEAKEKQDRANLGEALQHYHQQITETEDVLFAASHALEQEGHCRRVTGPG
jgi:hypothetical protein